MGVLVDIHVSTCLALGSRLLDSVRACLVRFGTRWAFGLVGLFGLSGFSGPAGRGGRGRGASIHGHSDSEVVCIDDDEWVIEG